VADLPAHATAQLEADLGQLGRLPGAGLACHDHDLVLRDGLGDLVALLAHRQRVGVGDRRHRGAPARHPRGGLVDLARDLGDPLPPDVGVAELAQPVEPAPQPPLVAQRQLIEALAEVGRTGARTWDSHDVFRA
jgi:hypothetical protein